MYKSTSIFFSTSYSRLESYFLKKRGLSKASFIQVLKNVPKEVQEISYFPDLSDTSIDIISQGFKQLPENVISLNFWGSHMTEYKNAEELVQIFKAFPSGLQNLILNHLEEKSADELVQMFQALPIKLRSLSFYACNGLYQKTTDELVHAFSALPQGLRSLKIEEIGFSKRGDSERLIQALPGRLIHLDLRRNDLGRMSVDSISKILKELPDSLTSLDLSWTELEKKSCTELLDILSAIPPQVTELSLASNGLEKRAPNELKQLYQTIEEHVELLHLEYNKPPIRINELKQSNRAKPHQTDSFPLLTPEEKRQEFGYLVALERSQRALWRKNPQVFREDYKNFIAHLEQKGISVPDDLSKAVNYFMAYSIKLIAQINNFDKITSELFDINSRGGVISRENPIKVKAPYSFNSQGISVWTSLVLLSSLITDKKINLSEIEFFSSDFDTRKELGRFSLFSANSFYHTKFKEHLNKEAIFHYLMHASTPIQDDELADEQVDKLCKEQEEHAQVSQQTKPNNLETEVLGPKITANVLCQLTKAGSLAEIKKYIVTSEEINALVRNAIWGGFASTLGLYNALMIAVAYRHFDIVRYFIEEKQADCSIQGGRRGDITLVDCAKRNWWFIAKSDESLIQYTEGAWLKSKQVKLAHDFVDKEASALDDETRLQLKKHINPMSPGSVCVKLAKAYEQTSNLSVSSTENILTFLSQAVELKDKEAALELGQIHQINATSSPANTAFDCYIKAAELGQEEALIPLEHLAKKANAAQKLKLSQLYSSFFHDEEKAAYWQAKSKEISDSTFTL